MSVSLQARASPVLATGSGAEHYAGALKVSIRRTSVVEYQFFALKLLV